MWANSLWSVTTNPDAVAVTAGLGLQQAFWSESVWPTGEGAALGICRRPGFESPHSARVAPWPLALGLPCLSGLLLARCQARFATGPIETACSYKSSAAGSDPKEACLSPASCPRSAPKANPQVGGGSSSFLPVLEISRAPRRVLRPAQVQLRLRRGSLGAKAGG